MNKETIGMGLFLAGNGVFLAFLHYIGVRAPLLATMSLLSILGGLALAIYGLFGASVRDADSQVRNETEVHRSGSTLSSHNEQIEGQVRIADGRLVFSIGIETLGDVFTTLIEAGTSIPCERRQIFSTTSDDQTEIEVHVLQGSSARASANTSLGKFMITGLPKAHKGVPQIEVIFRVQPNAEFVLMARNLETRSNVHVVRV